MKYNELFTSADNGIFTVFAQRYPDDFDELFEGVPSTDLNSVALALYGNKELLDYITPDNWELFIRTCISLNVSRWIRCHKVMMTEYDILTPNKTVKTKTGTQGDDVSDESQDLSANKPYNEENFDDNERRTQTKTHRQTVTYDLNETVLSSGGNTPENIRKELELRKQNLVKHVIYELVKELSIDLYK